MRAIGAMLRFDGQPRDVRDAAVRETLLNLPYYYERMRRS
jgi:hypothetical protein